MTVRTLYGFSGLNEGRVTSCVSDEANVHNPERLLATMYRTMGLLAALSLTSYAVTAHTRTPAFPGAQGGGAAAVGGRGGSVCEVTNLSDNGRNSFRDCLTRSGPRTVVFRVAGTIRL